jgi:hypothetical protein
MAIVLQRGKSRIYRDSFLAGPKFQNKILKMLDKMMLWRDSAGGDESRGIISVFLQGRPLIDSFPPD